MVEEATKPVPLGPQQSGGDPLTGAQVVCHNLVVDAGGALRRRPGIEVHPDFHSGQIDALGIDAIHATYGGKLFVAGGTSQAQGASRRSIYQVGASVATDISVATAGLLLGAGRPVTTETDALLVFAAGSTPQKVALDTSVSSVLGGSPPSATHILANSARLVINDIAVPSRVNFSSTAAGSSIAGHEQWNGTGTSSFFIAESRPDPVVALYDRTSELFVFGESTLQVHVADPQSVYSRSLTLEYGCTAPYGVVRYGRSFAWLDHCRRIQISDGRETTEVGQPIQETLTGLAQASDAFGFRVQLAGTDALLWSFPVDGRTLVYLPGGGWGQWSTGAEKSRHIANAVTRGGHEMLVGTTGGYIGRYSHDAQTDLGEQIVAYVETGAIDRGSRNYKRTRWLRPKMRRGEGTGTGSLYISWRDDEGPWMPPIEIALGPSGDTAPGFDFSSLGVYRDRRWRVEFSGDSSLLLAGMDESYEVLDR